MELDTVIALGIIAASIIIAFLFARRTNWRILKSSPAVEDSSESSALDHYTEMRDKLSLKKKDDEVIDENESSGVGSLIGPIIGIAVATIVAYNVLLPTLKTAQNTMNTTGWDSGVSNAVVSNLWGTTSILIVVGFVFIILSAFMGGSDDKPKKSKRKRGVEHYTEMRDKLTLESNENEKS